MEEGFKINASCPKVKEAMSFSTGEGGGFLLMQIYLLVFMMEIN